jgi:Mn2+/Fe2+ NRAMP family transporter
MSPVQLWAIVSVAMVTAVVVVVTFGGHMSPVLLWAIVSVAMVTAVVVVVLIIWAYERED